MEAKLLALCPMPLLRATLTTPLEDRPRLPLQLIVPSRNRRCRLFSTPTHFLRSIRRERKSDKDRRNGKRDRFRVVRRTCTTRARPSYCHRTTILWLLRQRSWLTENLCRLRDLRLLELPLVPRGPTLRAEKRRCSSANFVLRRLVGATVGSMVWFFDYIVRD